MRRPEYSLFRQLINLLGWRTRRKIVVIESDDWGSIRMPSNQVRNELIAGGVLSKAAISHYSLNDSLESNQDLQSLFQVLESCRDSNGRHPMFTALCIVANPDFDRIESTNYTEYHYEPFTTTLDRYTEHDQVYQLWKEGYEKQLFIPQFHGREHLNVTAWMHALQSGHPKTLAAFRKGFTSFGAVECGESNIHYQAAFDIYEPIEISYLKTVLIEGTALFEQLMGYKASYFVPTNGPFSLDLEPTLKHAGISYYTLNKLQKEPLGYGKYRTHIRWLGKKNAHGQVNLSRNAFFEPSVIGKNWVDSCILDIERAFKWHKPATISTHRVNYIGLLNPENRSNGLKQLKALLDAVISRWPNVEFMSSPELGEIILSDSQTR
jgi:hypothetical protein